MDLFNQEKITTMQRVLKTQHEKIIELEEENAKLQDFSDFALNQLQEYESAIKDIEWLALKIKHNDHSISQMQRVEYILQIIKELTESNSKKVVSSTNQKAIW